MNKRCSAAKRVTWIGLISNLGLTVFKLIAGIIGHSGAMISDAIHSLSDFGTDIVVIASFRIVGKPADKDHDYGHGKYETLAAAIVGGLLLLVGAEIFRNGIIKCWGVLFQGLQLEAPGHIALIAAAVSIAMKEWLYRYTRTVGRRISSEALIANAWHHRSDALSSVGAMFGIGGAIFLGKRWHVLDPIAAVIVSLFIVLVAVKILAGSIRELTEVSLGDEVKAEILEMARSVGDVSHPHNLRTRRIGNTVAVDLHIRVPSDMKVLDAHAITTEIEKKIFTRFGQDALVSIHVEPQIQVRS